MWGDGREFKFPFMGLRAEANTGVCVRGRTTLWGHALKSLKILMFCTFWQCVLHAYTPFWYDSAFHQSLAQAEGLIWIDAVLLLYLVLLCFTVISSLQSSRCIRAQDRSFGIGNAIHCFVSKFTGLLSVLLNALAPKSVRFTVGLLYIVLGSSLLLLLLLLWW